MHHFKRLFVLGGMLLAASLLFTLSPIRTPTTYAATTIACPASQSEGADNDWVQVIQWRLNGLNDTGDGDFAFPGVTMPLSTDGSFGPATETAVVDFQNDVGIGSSGGGVVGNRTWAAMGFCTGYPAQVAGGNGYTYSYQSCPPAQSDGNSNDFVNAAQHILNMDVYEGYIPSGSWYQLSLDGFFGANTLAAVNDFQSASRISGGGGVIGNRTWAEMGMC